MKRWLLGLPLLVLLGLAPALALRVDDDDAARSAPAVEGDVVTSDILGLPLPAPVAEPTNEDGVQQAVDASRRTAIVVAAERVAPAVVSVNVIRRETFQPRSMWESFFMPPGVAREVPGLGSGFIIDGSGLVLTNEHVVRGATELVVTLRDGRDFDAELVGSDEVTDLALLRLRDVRGTLPVAPLGRSSNLIIGEWVVAIGNPFGFMLANAEATVTAGVVSGVNRNIIPEGGQGGGWYLDMIQTDASINPGNSGGPLVNALGEVIGVNSSIISGGGGSVGLGFAIPIDRARRIAQDL
ncbi:MAG TPA: trypsin-like peptidase domain-containing protein, partial [Longimicrobiales bacterium]|nr:trypsin-like peptidase domain-containing protein [Longimicrobiales bacterium]